MSERKSFISKRNLSEVQFQDSNIKRLKLDDDDDDSADSKEITFSTSSSSSSVAYSASNSEAFSFSEESDHYQSYEIATNTRLPFLDLEVRDQVSETEISTLLNSNFRSEKMESTKKAEKREKAPTQAEIDEFFSAAESCQQKRFTDKYNYDIVNDTPLQGRYQWVTLNP